MLHKSISNNAENFSNHIRPSGKNVNKAGLTNNGCRTKNALKSSDYIMEMCLKVCLYLVGKRSTDISIKRLCVEGSDASNFQITLTMD